MLLYLPVDNYVTDKKEEETYKLITRLTICRLNTHFTCFCKSFVLFVNEREVNPSKSHILKLFSGVNSVSKFLELNLPIASVHAPTPIKSEEEFISNLRKTNADQTCAFEIDLSQPKKIQRALGNTKLDCYPVLWVNQMKEKVKWPINFKQRIACKYLAVKLLDIHRGEIDDG